MAGFESFPEPLSDAELHFEMSVVVYQDECRRALVRNGVIDKIDTFRLRREQQNEAKKGITDDTVIVPAVFPELFAKDKTFALWAIEPSNGSGAVAELIYIAEVSGSRIRYLYDDFDDDDVLIVEDTLEKIYREVKDEDVNYHDPSLAFV